MSGAGALGICLVIAGTNMLLFVIVNMLNDIRDELRKGPPQ